MNKIKYFFRFCEILGCKGKFVLNNNDGYIRGEYYHNTDTAIIYNQSKTVSRSKYLILVIWHEMAHVIFKKMGFVVTGEENSLKLKKTQVLDELVAYRTARKLLKKINGYENVIGEVEEYYEKVAKKSKLPDFKEDNINRIIDIISKRLIKIHNSIINNK